MIGAGINSGVSLHGVTEHQPLVAGALLGGFLAFRRLARPRPARCPGFAR